jgi:hypothetical protein
MMGGPFPPNMSEMDMAAMAAAMQSQMGAPNPLMLQEMMMNQMALMAQMASSLGMLNPGMMGMPMQQGGMPDMGMFNPGGPMGVQGHQGPGPMGRGRGGPPSRGRGGRPSQGRPPPMEERQTSASAPAPQEQPVMNSTTTPQVAVPTPRPVTSQSATSAPPVFAAPERPQSATLCKFGLKCTNMHCRWSHPSPVATAESGVVLSNDPCENGKNCKDKDCIKAHVSPAVANPSTGALRQAWHRRHEADYLLAAVDHNKSHPAPAPSAQHAQSQAHPSSAVQCRYGMGCTRRDCTFQHPPAHPLSKTANAAAQSQPCRFGASCTRSSCQYQHPEGRVLPTSFHRGVAANAPLVSVPSPATGSMGAPSPHKSVVFNSNNKLNIERKLKELQEEKSRAEEKMKAAEAAAAGKKDTAGEPAVALAA